MARGVAGRPAEEERMIAFIVSLLLGGLAVMIAAAVLPNFQIQGGFKTSLAVAFVYGLLKALLQEALIFVTLPAVLLTLGLFIVVINAFLLWLTDMLIEKFEVKTKGALVMGALLLSLIDWGFQLVLRNGTIF
jgi:putative membrane protein